MKLQGKTLVKAEDILYSTNFGLDVYQYEIGSFPSQAFCSPLRRDRNPSFRIHLSKDGIWRWQDLATGEFGDCIEFVMKRHNLDRNKAIERICSYTTYIVERNIPYKVKRERKDDKLGMRWTTCGFDIGHRQFWGEIEESFIARWDCSAINQLSFNGSPYRIKKGERVFIYQKAEGEGKAYFADRTKGEKFRGNVRDNYFWYLDRIKEPVENLFVVKSNKDAILLAWLGLSVTTPMNEGEGLFTDEIDALLRSKGKNIVLAFGTNAVDKQKSINVSKKYNYSWYNIPNKIHEQLGCTDFFDWFKEQGVQPLREHLKEKGFL